MINLIKIKPKETSLLNKYCLLNSTFIQEYYTTITSPAGIRALTALNLEDVLSEEIKEEKYQ